LELADVAASRILHGLHIGPQRLNIGPHNLKFAPELVNSRNDTTLLSRKRLSLLFEFETQTLQSPFM
jgi:hypothetical protein